MSEKKKIYKPKAISGYPEWLPAVRRVEQEWLDHIRRVFESYGFCNIETPSVEELDVIAAKGEDVDKEIYVLERLQAEPDDKKEARLALHFDQTVPLARYVGQHFNDLVFPFKRYQMQKVWRGERPQSGRFREFYQCDIDVINVDNLPLHFDAEMPAIIYEVLSGLDIPPFQIRISNRKILIGLLEGLDLENIEEITRIIDKLEKIGEDHTKTLLIEHGVNDQQIDHIFGLVHTKDLYAVVPDNETMAAGLEELGFVMEQLSHLPEGAVVADLSIVRGLDYYTGTVYETVFLDDPSYGSICSGGRYDDLASSYINKRLPGVGISIGFSRLFAKLVPQLETSRISPADILVALPNEGQRGVASQTAATLRARGMNVELYHAPQKIGKQIGYAEKKGIPYVWFPPFDEAGTHEVKNLTTGQQEQAAPEEWKIDA